MQRATCVIVCCALAAVVGGCGTSAPPGMQAPVEVQSSSGEAAPMTMEMFSRADEGIGPGQRGDQYDQVVENNFIQVAAQPLSTFSIDVDTASYAKTRMYLMQQSLLPPPDAVRIEELINYFVYDYEGPSGDQPFSTEVEVAQCPWREGHLLAKIGIQATHIEKTDRPASNLVFLLDVSGSMNRPNKLPLLKRGMKMLVDQLGENDRVAIVAYAGAAGLVLDSTNGNDKQTILDALERLHAGGSTNGGKGIQLAYQVALDHFIQGGVNRVLLCTDGDFNVGATSQGELIRFAEKQAKAGVRLSVFGFGAGNLNDSLLENISNKADGEYVFIDDDQEARKALVEQLSGTLVTVAKDVKIQVEFNPQRVAAYRLIGYENRLLEAQEFNDDEKDAGEIGAGRSVTAIYEITPVGVQTDIDVADVDALKYQTLREPSAEAASAELFTVKIRYKAPESDTSQLISLAVEQRDIGFDDASANFRFAAAVAGFGMLLRESKHRGNLDWARIEEMAADSLQYDPGGYRAEFLKMAKKAGQLAGT